MCAPTWPAKSQRCIRNSINALKSQAMTPRTHVVTVFQEVPAESFYVGGEPVDNFVRIVIDHIARVTPAEARPLAMAVIESQLAPHIKDRALDWELHIDETPIDLWRVQGLPAPPFGSDAEKKWIADNKPSHYNGAVAPDLSPDAITQLVATLNPALAEATTAE